MWSDVGDFPGLIPCSQDSVPQMMSGLVYSSTVASSCVLDLIPWQLMFIILRFDLLGVSNTDDEKERGRLDKLAVLSVFRAGDFGEEKDTFGVLAFWGEKGLDDEMELVLDKD